MAISNINQLQLKVKNDVNKLTLESDKRNHIIEVTNFIQFHMLELSPSVREMSYVAALSHDIGYAKELKITGFHPVDSFIYLSQLTDNEEILNAVLHHTCSQDLQKIIAPELNDVYAKYTFNKTEVYDVVTLSDCIINNKGEIVGMQSRLTNVGTRYGNESPEYRNMQKAIESVRDGIVKYRIPEHLK